MTPKRMIKFLLVDDLEANLLALEALLANDDRELLKARSGREALELLLEHEIALALIDVQMPEMSGFELAEIMRGTERTRGVPIIFLTAGVVDQPRRIRGYETGAVDFLPKPIDPESLLTKVATFHELARQREELARRNAELAEAAAHKDRFLAMLAHELRNPLAPVLTGAAMIASNPDAPPAVVEIATMMRRQMGQMVHLIDDLLDVSRINTGKIILKRSRRALAAIMEEAVEASRPLIEERNHRLEVLPPDPELMVFVDRHRLSQVISNLLSNAAKYTPPGGRIDLSAEPADGEMVRISVRDTGEGLSADALERIFGMFEQVDPARQDGLGIGLTLVKNLVELHGGSVSVSSDGPGKGAEFSVVVPLAVAGETGQVEEPRPEEKTSRAVPAARVMVVDDGKNTADILLMFLESEGMEGRVAYDGEEAVKVAMEFKPRIIFMDLGMPVMDGYEAARRIREVDQEVILIALSGWGREEDRARSKEAGFNGHAVKPVAPADLRVFLEQLA